jgi:hypothetical protein
VSDAAQNGRSRRRQRRAGGAASQTGGGSLVWGVMFAGTLAGGVVLTLDHFATAGWFCLALAGATALGWVVKR